MTITQSTALPLEHGLFTIAYHVTDKGNCISIRYGDLQNKLPIVRFHSSCLFGESLHALDCECAQQLTSTLKMIKKNGSGVIIYKYDEGRGIGLENKLRVLELQRRHKINTVEAFRLLGFEGDMRTFEIETAALGDLEVNKNIQVATQNPRKLAALETAGFKIVKEVHPFVQITKYNVNELRAKKNLLGYHIKDNLEVRP